MSGEEARDYDEFMRLKTEACELITESNAVERLEAVKIQIITVLNRLNVNNITEVEDLYLIVAQLTQAATYVAAKNKMVLKNISFEDALGSIGTDDLLSVLEQTFVSQPEVENFFKFVTIDETYKPDKQAWSGLHARMEVMARRIAAAAAAAARDKILTGLKVTVPDYLTHLEGKLTENGVNIPSPEVESANGAAIAAGASPPRIVKLIARYQAINELNSKILNAQHLSEEEITGAKANIQTCLNNKPDWSERPFLKKLADIFSFGLKPLYRAFFSKEKKFQETMEQTVTPIKKGR